MILHTREFDVHGSDIIVAHDRETGKRYFGVEIQDITDCQRFIPEHAENAEFWDVLRSIFWLK